MLEISLEEFFVDYKPQTNHIIRAKTNSDIADEDITSWSGCMYETYGEELNYIISLIKDKKTKQIWTIIEAGDNCIVQAGYWVVNRMGYIVTEQTWDEENIIVTD
jgi:hypothetical protein